jgi:hypothetical protein
MGLFEFEGAGGGGGFGTSIGDLLTKPGGLSTGTRTSTTVAAVVPDGVATVDLTFANGATATATIADNLWTTHFDGSPERTHSRRRPSGGRPTAV